nr:hypothetical protein [Acidipila sp. EB88]
MKQRDKPLNPIRRNNAVRIRAQDEATDRLFDPCVPRMAGSSSGTADKSGPRKRSEHVLAGTIARSVIHQKHFKQVLWVRLNVQARQTRTDRAMLLKHGITTETYGSFSFHMHLHPFSYAQPRSGKRIFSIANT